MDLPGLETKRRKKKPLREIRIRKKFDSARKKACPESWSSFKDFKVDEKLLLFDLRTSGQSSLLTFLSTKWEMLERGMLELTSDQFLQLVTRNLTLQQVVEFQPWIYYSLIRSRLELEILVLLNERRVHDIELILNSICSRLGGVRGLLGCWGAQSGPIFDSKNRSRKCVEYRFKIID